MAKSSPQKGAYMQKYSTFDASLASDIIFSFPTELLLKEKHMSIVFMRLTKEECSGYLRLSACKVGKSGKPNTGVNEHV